MKQTLIIDARPPAKLLPNRRRHWSDNYRKDVKDYLTLVWIRCKEQKIQPVKGHATLTFIFYLKTKGKKRGYIEKQEVEVVKPISEVLFDEL